MADKLGSLAQEFLDSVYVSGYVPGEKPRTSGARKRTADPATDGRQKAAKTETVGDMKEIANSGKVRRVECATKVGDAAHTTMLSVYKCNKFIVISSIRNYGLCLCISCFRLKS
jgi:hypothetical protein